MCAFGLGIKIPDIVSNQTHLIKQKLTSSPVLVWYGPSAETKTTADASAYGLKAVVMQKIEQQWKLVAYASRSMTETETRYAQIEKEALAATWACERFSDYILGMKIHIETDHKPLLGSKFLDSLPPRILRFLVQFDYTISHIPGKLLYIADILSRLPEQFSDTDQLLAELTEHQMTNASYQLPTTKNSVDKFHNAQREDSICSKVIIFCQTPWPEKHAISGELRKYLTVRNELTVCDSLLLCRAHIVVPAKLQHDALCKIHRGHQGIKRCRLRETTSV